jgi:methionyl-tRNA formyltransferase
MKARIAYFGSPNFSARLLEKLIQDPDIPAEIVVVVTQSDKAVGRDQTITPSPVKRVAEAKNIPVLHNPTAEQLQPFNLDVALVFAYGKIISEPVLKVPKHGFWNIHPSLLPLYRGASPCAYTLLMGDEMAGCSLMLMDAQMDHGPIMAQESYRVAKSETNESLLEKLTYVGYYMFKDHIFKLMEGSLNLQSFPVQNDSLATFTRLLKRDDGYIENALIRKAFTKEKITTDELPLIIRNYLGQNAVSAFPILYAPFIVYNMYRGLHPWPGIWTYIMVDGMQKRLKITRLELNEDSLYIRMVQLEGKSEVPFEQFIEAYPDSFGPMS